MSAVEDAVTDHAVHVETGVRAPRVERSSSAKFQLPAALLTTLLSVLTFAACAQQKTAEASKSVSAGFAPATYASADSAPPPSINSARAMQYLKEVVGFGPRPIGSANHKQLEDYIYSHLKGALVEDDFFVADTPEGKLPVRNIIAKFPGARDGVIVIAGHYDTNYPLRNTAYLGANDSGSSTALLLELADQLRGNKRDGYSVWLVWTDGEEAVLRWTETDSVYGTRHLAELWQKDGTIKKIKAFLLADMIGDADLNVDRVHNATPWLEDLVLQAATRLGYQSHFFARTLDMNDDFTPLMRVGVPCADLIDFDYGYGNVFWHTPQDTVDKLNPKSLQIVGSVLLETVRLLDQK